MFSYDDDDDSKESNDKWKKLLQGHRAEVRYLRYQEFIDRQGDEFSEWYWSETHSTGFQIGPVPTLELLLEEEAKDILTLENIKKDADLTEHQVVEMGKAFSMGFGSYIDSDRFSLGMAHGVKQVGGIHSGTTKDETKFYNFEVSLSTITQQCNDIITRYRQQQRPLGENTAAAAAQDERKTGRKKKGKNKNQTSKKNTKSHEECIQNHLSKLIVSLEQNMTLSMAYARLTTCICDMLIKGAVHDPAIRRCIVSYNNGNILKAILRMRIAAARNAKGADVDPSRSLEAAFHWWIAYESITELIGETVGRLGNEDRASPEQDVEDAIQAFHDKVLPDFLKSFEQREGVRVWFTETQVIWKALHQILCQFPKKVATKFVKKHWKLLEASSLCDIDNDLKLQDDIQYGDCEGVKVREANMAPKAGAELTRLISNLCGYGMEVDETMGRKVTPGPLAVRMLKNGVVHLLMKCAGSDDDAISGAAVYGLSQISRFKDCRQIMLQEPNNEGVELVKSLMTSNHANRASSAMLLVVHLGWDEKEWGEPLRNMRPGIETLCMKWAAFSMKTILKKAAEMKEAEARAQTMRVKEISERFRANSLKDDDTKKKRVELEANESKITRENTMSWRELETEDQVDIVTLTLSRCLILLSSALVMSNVPMSARLSKIDFLHLSSACIDSPIADASTGALHILRNSFSLRGIPPPSSFPDAGHLLEGIFYKIEECVGGGKPPNQYGYLLLQTATYFHKEPEWKNLMAKLMKKDEKVKWYMEKLSGGQMFGGPNVPFAASPKRPSAPRGIPESNTRFSGNLAKCNGCGQFEGKKGQWKRCSRCQVAKYCGTECQTKDWKKHKKQCKDLGQSKK